MSKLTVFTDDGDLSLGSCHIYQTAISRLEADHEEFLILKEVVICDVDIDTFESVTWWKCDAKGS